MTQAERDRIAELEATIGIEGPTPLAWDCHPRERTWRLFTFLVKRGNATSETILATVWGDKGADVRADVAIVPVMVSYLRKGLRPFGIDVRNIWGEGYGFTPEMRIKARELIERLRREDTE